MTHSSDEYADKGAPSRVVAGVDGSENAARAAAWAAREALARRVELTLVHALEMPSTSPFEPPEYAGHRRAAGQRLLDETAATLRKRLPDLHVGTELSDLAPARTLSTLSTEAALLVTGTRGHGGFAGMLLGSVSRKLAAHAHCPLVVVRGEPAEATLDEVVLGIEPGQSQPALDYAFAAASRYGAALHAVRAWSPTAIYTGLTGGYYEDVTQAREEEVSQVETLLEPLAAAYPEVKTEISAGRGNPVPLLIEAARDARLVVVGAHRHRGPLAVGAGYVVDGLLAHCPTPVAVVPIRP